MILLQKMLLPENREGDTELFYRSSRSFSREINLRPDDKISFDTYYNSFSYPKFLKYTSIKEATLKITAKGVGTASLCVFDGNEHEIKTCEISCENKSEIMLFFNLSELPKNGFAFLRINAIGDFTLFSADYFADAFPQKISCCAVICTYKREEYVAKNISSLESEKIPLLKQVLIIDNGNSLDEKKYNSEPVSVLKNRNLGGSGGFTRGLIEAHCGGFSHVILMDDDIIFYPQIIERMLCFLSVLKSEYRKSWFSAAMLSKERNYFQYESGGNWNGTELVSCGNGIDIRSRENLLKNMTEMSLNYGAWWCLAMPIDVISEYGLPIPFFIKFDDVEYGLRRNADTKIITMNGIAVTHEDFNAKYSPALEYYSLRNSLVTNAVHGLNPKLSANVKRLFCACGKQLILYRYDCFDLIIRAYSDFLKGVDFFLKCDGERLHKELSAHCKKQIPLSKIPEWDEELRVKGLFEEKYFSKDGKRYSRAQILTLGGHLIPWFLLKKEPAIIPISANKWQECYRRKTVIQYQPRGDCAAVYSRSFGRFLLCCFKLLGAVFALIFKFNSAREDYRKNIGKITCEEFHKEYLNVGGK